MIIDNNDAEILLSTPTISSVPATTSAKAIGICISAGIPRLDKNPTNPGLNFPDPCTMKITPTTSLIPKWVMS